MGQRLERTPGTAPGPQFDLSNICDSRSMRALDLVVFGKRAQVARVLHKLQDTTSVHLDRWTVAIQLRDGAGLEEVVMNNYFSIGCAAGQRCAHARHRLTSPGVRAVGCGCVFSMGAQVVLQFDQGRKRNPQLYSSRLFNKAVYAWDGLKDSIVHSCKDLHLRIRVEVRSERVGRTAAVRAIHPPRHFAGPTYTWRRRTQLDDKPFELPHLEEVIALNIPSYASGSDLWAGARDAAGNTGTVRKPACRVPAEDQSRAHGIVLESLTR